MRGFNLGKNIKGNKNRNIGRKSAADWLKEIDKDPEAHGITREHVNAVNRAVAKADAQMEKDELLKVNATKTQRHGDDDE